MKYLTFSGEVTYTMLDQKFTGTVTPGTATRIAWQAGWCFLRAEGPEHGRLPGPRSA